MGVYRETGCLELLDSETCSRCPRCSQISLLEESERTLAQLPHIVLTPSLPPLVKARELQTASRLYRLSGEGLRYVFDTSVDDLAAPSGKDEINTAGHRSRGTSMIRHRERVLTGKTE